MPSFGAHAPRLAPAEDLPVSTGPAPLRRLLKEDITEDAGAINVVYGSSGGLTTVGNQYWHQGVVGVLDELEPYDAFGSGLAALPIRRHRVYLPLLVRDD
jgi:hypothetical protein